MNTAMRRTLAGLLAVALTAALIGACSAGASGGLKISDAWSRPSPKTAGAGAAYMIIENGGSAADALIGGTSPIATTVEVHETVEMGSAMPGASGGAMLGMQKTDRLEIPAGGRVELKPGSYHIMLIDLTRELVVGETIEITLRFEKAGEVKVKAQVRAS